MATPNWLDVTASPYNAAGDGTTDDTTAVQSAITAALNAGGGTVYFPGGKTFKITSTLVVGQDSSQVGGINLVGDGPQISVLKWTGGASACLRIARQKYYQLEKFQIQGDSNSKASGGIGINVAAPSAPTHGTLTSGGVWNHLKVNSFDRGISVGEQSLTNASSEHEVHSLQVDSCNIGVHLEDFNTLNWLFTNLSGSGNGKLLDCPNGANSVEVVGGSASNQTTADFNFGTGGRFSIRDFRSEGSNRFFTGGFTNAGLCCVVIDGCHVKASTNADGVLVTCSSAFNLRLESSLILGHVQVSPINSVVAGVSMRCCGVNDSIPFGALSPNTLNKLRYSVLECFKVDSSGNLTGWFADEVGTCDGQNRRNPVWVSL